MAHEESKYGVSEEEIGTLLEAAAGTGGESGREVHDASPAGR